MTTDPRDYLMTPTPFVVPAKPAEAPDTSPCRTCRGQGCDCRSGHASIASSHDVGAKRCRACGGTGWNSDATRRAAARAARAAAK